MSYREKYIGESPIKNSPKKALGLVLKDGAVTNSKIASGSVTNDKLAPESVDESKLAPELADRINESTIDPNQIAWIDEQMLKELKEEANNKFIITTSPENNSSYYVDESYESEMTITVTTEFNGDPVDCGAVTGWAHTEGTNVYTKKIKAQNGGGKTCAAQEFKYTVPSGKYAGIEVSGNSEERKVVAIQPFYYGWATTGDSEQAYKVIKTLTRSTGNTGSNTFKGTPAEKSWFWMIVSPIRQASIEQMQKTIVKNTEEISIYSPQNNTILLAGYTAYITDSFTKYAEIDWSVSNK